jgi:ABC-type phosphate/phosphonate transport system ATPase subunit/GNAT superfamily N-acetyltransferase
MIVKTIKRLATTKLVTFDDGKSIEVATSARVSKEDDVVKRLEVDEHNKTYDAYYVQCVNGEAQISPPYCIRTNMLIGKLALPVEIKEPTTQAEFDDVEYLSRFHYLGENCLKLSTLIVTTNLRDLPHTLGFIIIATAFNACAPRTRLLHALLSKDEMPGGTFAPSWFVARLVRAVVHPEFRGTGVGKLLAEHSVKYCRERFAVVKHRPMIVESVAAMHRYSPFVSKYMSYLGQTSGEKPCKSKLIDVDSWSAKSGSGQADFNRKYVLQANEIAKTLDVSVDALYEMLKDSSVVDVAKRVILHPLLRLPKPYYVTGLCKEAELVVRMLTKSVTFGFKPRELRMSGPIIFKNVDVTFEERAQSTERTFAVLSAFGISPQGFRTTVLHDFSLEIKPGEIMLLKGMSGSGKSIVLRTILHKLDLTSGEIVFPQDVRIANLEDIQRYYKDNPSPLVDTVGESVEEAFYTLNRVGLGEAKVYMKPYAALSTGQKYRACVAKLVDSNANVWIADEFGSTLDFITANIVANSVQRHCRQCGITFIAACANPETYLASLQPDYVVDLSAGRTTITRGDEYVHKETRV